jgi:hypothetical protein
MRRSLQGLATVYPPGRKISTRPATVRHVDALSHLCERIYGFHAGQSLCHPGQAVCACMCFRSKHGASGLYAKWQWSRMAWQLGVDLGMFWMAKPLLFWSPSTDNQPLSPLEHAGQRITKRS